MMKKNKLGLQVGTFLAVVHAIWSLLVAAIPAELQNFVTWVLKLHHISLSIKITPFVLANAVELVIVTFVIGYILGCIFAMIVKEVGK